MSATLHDQPGETQGYTVSDHIKQMMPLVGSNYLVLCWYKKALSPEPYPLHGKTPIPSLDREAIAQLGRRII